MPLLDGHVLITGAAGGIGTALAEAIRAHAPSTRLTLTDLGECDALAESLGGAVSLPSDLTAPGAPAELLARAEEAFGPVDVLVNNAGIVDFVAMSHPDSWQRGRRVLDIDLLAPLELSHLVLPGMLARGRGGLVQVASIAALSPMRGGVWYGAAKAGFAMASEALHMETRGTGVHVLTVYPGPITTPLEQKGRAQIGEDSSARILPSGKPDGLAREVVRSWSRGRRRLIYPSLYGVLGVLPSVGRWTAKLGPMPKER